MMGVYVFIVIFLPSWTGLITGGCRFAKHQMKKATTGLLVVVRMEQAVAVQ